jgi:hypothetical protein
LIGEGGREGRTENSINYNSFIIMIEFKKYIQKRNPLTEDYVNLDIKHDWGEICNVKM